MHDIGTAVNVVFPVLVLIVSGVCLLLFTTTTTLRATNGDLERRVAILEAEQTRDKDLIVGQATEIMALQKIVTGEVQLQAISDLLVEHHKQSLAAWARITEVRRNA